MSQASAGVTISYCCCCRINTSARKPAIDGKAIADLLLCSAWHMRYSRAGLGAFRWMDEGYLQIQIKPAS